MSRKIESYTQGGQEVPNNWGSKKFEHKSKLKKQKKLQRQNRKKGRKSNV